jgi:O-antigen ligase
LHGTVLSLAVFCPIGIMQFFGIDMPFLVPIFGPASTMGCRNPAAHYLVCNIPFAFLLAWHYLRPADAADKYTPAALLFGTLGIMALVHVFMTATRTAILALMVYTLALPFMLLFGSGRKPNARLLLRTTASVILAIAVLGGLLMAFPQTRQRAMHTIRNAGSLSMLEARRFHWGNTLYMIRDQPLSGVGLGNWQFNYPRYSHRYMRDTCFNLSTQVQRVHNDYLQLTAECGIPALLVFLVLWGRQFVRAWNSDDVFDHRLRYALICSMIAFSVIMLLSFPLQMGYSRMFFFFLLANGGGRL